MDWDHEPLATSEIHGTTATIDLSRQGTKVGTAKSGSTILSFYQSFLNTQSVGDHTVTFIYGDDRYDVTVTILAADTGSSGSTSTSAAESVTGYVPPNTGDRSSLN